MQSNNSGCGIRTIKNRTISSRNLPLLTVLILIVSLCFGGPSVAAKESQRIKTATTQLQSSKAKTGKLLEAAESRISVLEKIESPDSSQKTETSWQYQSRDFLQKTISSIESSLGYIQNIQNTPKSLRKLEQELTKPLPEVKKVDSGLSLQTLEARLESARNDLETATRNRETLDAETAARGERQQKLAEESTSARKRAEELQQQVTTLVVDAADKTTEAKKTALSSEQLYLEHVLQELDWENKHYDATRELLRAQRQKAERELLITQKRFTALEEVVNSLRTQAATQTMQDADAASLAAISAHPLVRAVVEENQKLATELTQISILTSTLSSEKQQIDETLTTVRRQFDGIKEKIAQIGLIDAIGYKLRADRNLLPDLAYYQSQLKTHAKEINRVQLRRIEIEDRLLELVDLTRETSFRMNVLKHDLNEREKQILKTTLQNVLAEQKERYLNELIKTYDIYFEKNLFPTMEQERALVSLIKEYQEFIDTRILWIQSAPPFGLNDVKQLNNALGWLLNPIQWAEVVAVLGRDLKNNPFTVIAPLLVVILLLVFQKKLVLKLAELSRYVTKLSKAKFSDTIWGIVVTAMIAAPWPLLLFLLGWRLNQYSNELTLIEAFAWGCFAISHLLFAGLSIRYLCRQDGLCESHFRWPTKNLQLIRKQLNWFLPTVIPLVFIIAITANQPTQAHHESLGRIVFFALMIFVTLFIYRLMRPATGLLQFDIEKNPNGWLSRLSGIWFSLLLLGPLTLFATAAMGYFYTAIQLSFYLITTLYLLFAINIVHDFLVRWLNIAQRKLALEQWLKKNAAQSGETTQGEESSQADEDKLDISAISSQTIKLLNSAFWITTIIGTLLIWSEVLPAFKLLNKIVVWESEITSTESGTETTVQVPTTLVDFLLAITILAMTFVVSRNIPGLLEIAILQRLPFTPSGRYAITSIVRYILVIIGLGMTFNAIGIGWSKVQWLAAAITVGLGFGLQEIFANFVSGLIILFERPIRVGDSVTVGNISGKVSRIQMRATTITDWDRKELIIPNKEFVTGQVINWSLSDTILRIIVPVGIAYGSDTQLAYDTLLSVAKAHPNVLADPKPTVMFSQFGESSLDFELRVFVPDPDHRLETRHDLHMEIDRRFREANIEIAFPQRDLHVRSIDNSILNNVVTKPTSA